MGMSFNWDDLSKNLNEEAFKTVKKERDARFWVLAKDEDKNGAAIIRFLPDPNSVPFVSLIKISAQNKNRKGFFVSEWSPNSIGKPCPFNERFTELWNEGKREKAKTLGRLKRFITNIKVIKDPANPQNEGKIFLYEMSETQMDYIKKSMEVTDIMKELGEQPVAVFNPVEGQNFLIKSKKGANDIVSYADSKFSPKINGIYKSVEEAEKDIKENAYELKEFLDPENYLSYEELTDMRDRFLGEGKYSSKTDKETSKTDETSKKDEELSKKNNKEDIEKESEKVVEKETEKSENSNVSELDELDELLESDSNTDDELDKLLEELDED